MFERCLESYFGKLYLDKLYLGSCVWEVILWRSCTLEKLYLEKLYFGEVVFRRCRTWEMSYLEMMVMRDKASNASIEHQYGIQCCVTPALMSTKLMDLFEYGITGEES